MARVVRQGLIVCTCCGRCRHQRLLVVLLIRVVVLIRVVRRGWVGLRGCRRGQRLLMVVQVMMGQFGVQLVRVVLHQGVVVVVVRHCRCPHGHGLPLRTPLLGTCEAGAGMLHVQVLLGSGRGKPD